MANEVKELSFGSTSSPILRTDLESGSYDLTFDSQTTGSISYNAVEGTVQSELEALSSIGTGNVVVSTVNTGFVFTFQGALANTNVGALTAGNITLKRKADGISVTVVDYGTNPTPEEHRIELNGATTGTFDLTNGTTTETVSTLDTSGIQAAYDTIYGTGSAGATVSDLGGGVFSALFSSNGDRADPSVTNDTTDGSVSASSYTQGSDGSPWQVEVWLSDEPDAGTLSLTVDSGTPTSDFSWNASTSTINSELLSVGVSLSGHSGAGTTADPWVLTGPYAALSSFTGSEGGTPLRKSCGIEIATTTEGSGSGIDAESPVAIIDFFPVAPTSSKGAGSGIAVVDFVANAPSVPSGITADSGQGIIDLASPAAATTKSAASPAAVVDFLPVSPATAKSAAADACIVEFVAIPPLASKDAGSGPCQIDFVSPEPATSSGGELAACAIDLVAASPGSAKVAVADPVIVEILSVSPDTGTVAESDTGLLDLLGVEPESSKDAQSPPAIVEFLAIAPGTGIVASSEVAVVDFLSNEYEFTIVAESGIGSIDFVGQAPTSSSAAASGPVVIDLSAPLIAASKDVASGVVIVDFTAPSVTFSSAAAQPVVSLDLLGVAATVSKSTALTPVVIEFVVGGYLAMVYPASASGNCTINRTISSESSIDRAIFADLLINRAVSGLAEITS